MSPSDRARRPLEIADAAWLHMDEPTNLMVITIALLFDEPLAIDAVREVVERRLLGFARFRQRVANGTGQPAWEPDPHFTPAAHVHRVRLPGKGDDAALRELLGDLMSTSLDPSKPLWQIILAEGYGKGCALIVRVHHCVGDGVALGHMLGAMFDAGPEATPPAPPHKPAPATGPLAALGAALENLGAVVRGSEAVLNEGWNTVTHPERAIGMAGKSVGAVSKIALMSPDSATLLKGPLGVIKRAAWTEPVPLDEVKAAGKALGGTINDLLVAAASGGVRHYLEARGQPTDRLTVRAMMPVNLLPPGAAPAGGNHFGMVYIALPVSVEDPAERIRAVQKETAVVKASPEAALGYGIVSALGATPASVEHGLVELLCSRASAVLTNVPGPRATQYLAGKPIRRAMFWVPQAGRLALGISILSYAGKVQIGVAADAGLIPDPQALAAAMDAEIGALLRLERTVA
jgi:WS/DGAT/MGAT family acyltransferase